MLKNLVGKVGNEKFEEKVENLSLIVMLNVVQIAVKNFKILKMLPTSVEDVKKELNLTKVPVYSRLRKLEKNGLIEWHKGTGKLRKTELTEIFLARYEQMYEIIEKKVRAELVEIEE